MYKQSRKKIKTLGCAVSVLLLLSLQGCGLWDSGWMTGESTQAEETPVQLVLAVQSTVNSQAFQEMIRQYNDDQPGYSVEIISLPRDRYDETLNMLLTSDQRPDLFQASPAWLTTYVYKNWLMDLSQVADQELLDSYPQWALDYTRTDDHRFFALPSEMITLRLIYNKNLFRRMGLNPDQPPSTLQELEEYANQISMGGIGYRIYGFALPAGEIETYRMAMETASTYSGRYYYDFVTGRYDFMVYEQWFETLLSMKQQGGLFPGETTLMTETALTQFAQGNVGMMYATNRQFAQLNQMTDLDFELGIAKPPYSQYQDEGRGALMVSIQHPYVISNTTSFKEEAQELWRYLHSSTFLESMYRQGDLIPIHQHIYSETNLDNATQLAQFHLGKDESPYPLEPNIIVPQNSKDAVRMSAYRGIMQGLLTPAEALEQLTQQYNQNLNEGIYNQLISIEDYTFPEFDFKFPMQKFSLSDFQ